MSSKYVFLQGPSEIAEGQRRIGRAVRKRILQILSNTPKVGTHQTIGTSQIDWKTPKVGTHQETLTTPRWLEQAKTNKTQGKVNRNIKKQGLQKSQVQHNYIETKNGNAIPPPSSPLLS